MVPLALGTQTVGSVLRPAGYCGVVGLKPTHGLLSSRGVYPLAPSFDHVGVFARCVADAALALGVLASDDSFASVAASATPPRIGFDRRFQVGAADEEVSRHLEDVALILSQAGAQIVGSYDANRWVPEAEVIPPGIDLSRFIPAPPSDRRRPVILHAPSSRSRKGTEHVIAAVEGLDADLEIVEGLHHEEAFERFRNADIVVDQLNAGWYGLFAIECMALGKPVVTFLHDEAVRRTEEAFGTTVPLVSATAETLRERLRPLVTDAAERRRRGAASRAYVELVHDQERITDRLLDVYARL